MKKCTLCVDRIFDPELPEEERQPACVLTCPTHARFFGDYDDPDSEVSRLARERGGAQLMPELGYKPVNTYLPPRVAQPVPVYQVDNGTANGGTSDGGPDVGLLNKVKDWVNRVVDF